MYQSTMMDIGSEEGMEAAKFWIKEFTAKLQPVCVWGIPRSSAVYQIDQPNKVLTRLHAAFADEATELVFIELGYTVHIAET